MMDAMAVRDGRLDPATLSGERKQWLGYAQEYIAAGGKASWHFTQSFEDMKQDLEQRQPSRKRASALRLWRSSRRG
jgi:hypothetical protein